jgi:acyl-CoA thioesterase
VSAEPAHAYDVDTAVEAVADRPGETGRFAAVITDRWNVLGGRPNGGYVLGVALRALARVMPMPDPLVVSAFFLRPTLPGPVEVQTEEVRGGRRIATGAARVRQDGKEMVRVTAAFADLAAATGRTVTLAEKPALPPPDEAVDLLSRGAIPGLTLTERVEYRVAALPGWAMGRPSGRASMEFWMRYRDGRDADPLSLPALVDAAAPVILDLGEVGSATVELTVHVRARPAPGWLACRSTTRFVAGGFHEEDFEIWDAAGVLVAQSRQLALLP